MNTDLAFVEMTEAKRAVRASRRAFARSSVSVFVRTMWDAIAQYLEARSQGVSREHGVKGLEEELRGAWPKSVSKFTVNCDACDDTGWREMTCWDRHQCGRETCAANPEKQHLYVVICDCGKGDRFRKRKFTDDDQIAAVGRTQKSFTRFGR